MQVREYSSDGASVRNINLDSSLYRPHHCVELSSGEMVVSHGDWATEHRVCVINSTGNIIRSYGGTQGSDLGQMHGPRHMAIDKHDHLLVADCNNNRVELLSPTLTHLGYLQIPGHQLKGPVALHLDELNHRLFIAEWGGQRVIAVNYKISMDKYMLRTAT